MHAPVEILLIEDDDSTQEHVRRALAEFGPQFKLQCAEDGIQGLEYLRGFLADPNSRRPDLIFLDVNLPGVSGIDLLQEIKSQAVLRFIPVVIMAGSDDSDDIFACYLEHANACIVKTADETEFHGLIKETVHFWTEVAWHPARMTRGR